MYIVAPPVYNVTMRKPATPPSVRAPRNRGHDRTNMTKMQSRHMGDEPDRGDGLSEVQRTQRRMVTRVAYAPSKRQKALVSRRTLNVPLKDDEIYRGEDLKRGSR